MAKEHDKGGGGSMGYGRFAAMIAISTVVMFGLMYLNTYLPSHVFWSETRAYMALLMGATMAVIMLLFMLGMYSSKALNAAIFAGASLAFALTLWLVRSQVTVGDTSYMRAMIPHHSIAIMTSSRADISDPRVRQVADDIIYAQVKEIAGMRYLLGDMEANGDAPEDEVVVPGEIVTPDEALSTAETAILDPQFLTEAALGKVFPDGAACTFAYTETSPPVLAVGRDGGALIRISGDLVRLEAVVAGTVETGPTLTAEGIAMRLRAPDGESVVDARAGRREADLILEVEAGLRAGYRGFYGCNA